MSISSNLTALQQAKADIADAILAKGGNLSTEDGFADFPAAISGITSAIFPHVEIPAYVKAEVLSTAQRVKAVLTSDSIVFLAASDAHQLDSDANITAGNTHAGMALKALSYALPLDFAAYLGDYTHGNNQTTVSEGLSHFANVNHWLEEAFQGIPNFRTIGNHDPLGYSQAATGQTLSPQQLFGLVGTYNTGATYGSRTHGYCYKDFTAKHLRVILLNTAEGESYGAGAAENVSAAQLSWFSTALTGTPEGYGVLILSHHPLDWGNVYPAANALHEYISTHPNIAYCVTIHGHTHCLKVDNLYYVSGGTAFRFDTKRIAIPNMCFSRNNEYGTNGGTEYRGIEFGEVMTYGKTAGTGSDTALCVCVINPSSGVLYAICHGAGYDRTISLASNLHSIHYTLNHVSSSGSQAVAEEGDSFTTTLTAASGYEMRLVTVTMGGNNITATAYNTTTGKVSIANVTGDIVITATATAIVSYVNQIPISTDESGAIYNNGLGYKTDTRITTSGGTESAQTGYCVTGFIPAVRNDVFRLRGIVLGSTKGSTSNQNLVAYNSSKQRVNAINLGNFSTGLQSISEDADGNIVQFTLNNTAWGGTVLESVAYIRLTAVTIDEDSVITRNEEIT